MRPSVHIYIALRSAACGRRAADHLLAPRSGSRRLGLELRFSSQRGALGPKPKAQRALPASPWSQPPATRAFIAGHPHSSISQCVPHRCVRVRSSTYRSTRRVHATAVAVLDEATRSLGTAAVMPAAYVPHLQTLAACEPNKGMMHTLGYPADKRPVFEVFAVLG